MLMAFFLAISSTSLKADVYRTIITNRTLQWEDATSWIGGVVPPSTISPGDSIVVNSEVVLMTSLGNHGGHVIINDNLIVYGGDTGRVLHNGGLLEIYGALNLFPGSETSTEDLGPNGLLNDIGGQIDLHGSINVLGGEVLNEHVIDVYPGGAVRAFGYQVSGNSNVLQTVEGDIYSLISIATSFTSGTVTVSDDDPTDFGSGVISWVCINGVFQNNATINLLGGIIDESDCGGGGFTGIDAVDPLPTCSRPTNLRHDGDLATGLKLEWDPVAAATSYYVGLKIAGSPRYQRILSVDAADNQLLFPGGYFPAGLNIEWAVLTVCDAGIDLDNLAVSSDVLGRFGSVATIEGQSINMFPNPAQDVLYIELAKPVENGTVEVYDMSGRVVLRENFQTETPQEWHAVSIGHMSDGIYVVKVVDGNVIEQNRVRIAR